MKIVVSILAAAVLIGSGVMLYLVKQGAALRPAGVIAPTEIGAKTDLVGKHVALRLFPDFQTAKNVIWYLNVEEPHISIPETTLLNYQTNSKPELIDLRKIIQSTTCVENCWYVQTLSAPIPEALVQKMKTEPSIEIYVQYFERAEPVPEICETEKILDLNCARSVSVREVRKKLKKPAPYFFMRRYLDSQFYLYIEKTN